MRARRNYITIRKQGRTLHRVACVLDGRNISAGQRRANESEVQLVMNDVIAELALYYETKANTFSIVLNSALDFR